ncbi:MAG: response regulator [Mariprofundaceae bacterium]|nr:response regulator [Mariprofundaceae bacterium]
MRKTVLVVEDSGSSRDLTAHFLQQGGFRVLEATDGRQGLAILAERHVDLILADIMMPNMDGWEFHSEVRKQKKFNLTPFVFLSVLDELEDQIKGLSLGVDDYITKPVEPQKLLARVSTALMRGDRLLDYYYLDPVNDLGMPTYFRYRLEHEAIRCRQHDRPLTLVVVDIGNFVSMARGQAEWLATSAAQEAGQAISLRLRDYDLCADMGQGRLAILMPEMDEDGARSWAESLRENWHVSVLWPETEQKIGVDIGFSLDVLAPGEGSAVAVLDKRLQSLERKW